MEMTKRQEFFLETVEKSGRIQSAIGYDFKNVELLCQAFTRKSYTEENKSAFNNEVLEFYGDKALDFIVMKKMSEHYGKINADKFYQSGLDEGQLTEIKKRLVCKEILANKIKESGFSTSLICGIGDTLQKVWEQDSVQEDLFEAILGAVAIDSNWDVDALTKVIDRMLDPEFYFQNGFDDQADFVELIQQWYQKKYHQIPIYNFSNAGRDFSLYQETPREELGSIQCDLPLPPLRTFKALGKTQSAARKAVAKKAYTYLKKNNLLYSLVDEIGKPDLKKAVNQLQELYQKGYISEPQYTFSETYDENGNPVWDCECYLGNLGQGFIVAHSSKKQAKKMAAYNMVLLYLGEEAGWEDDEA